VRTERGDEYRNIYNINKTINCTHNGTGVGHIKTWNIKIFSFEHMHYYMGFFCKYNKSVAVFMNNPKFVYNREKMKKQENEAATATKTTRPLQQPPPTTTSTRTKTAACRDQKSTYVSQ
jgi:hypothetical protein